MTDTTANLALPMIIAAQAQKHVTHNEALRDLDALVQLAVLDRDLTAPPGSPGEGERWLVAAGASGAWGGHDGEVAAWQDGGWDFHAARAGWLAYVVDEAALIAFDGTAWQPAVDVSGVALQNLTLLGVGTTADSTNPVSAKLNNALWAAKTVAEGGSGDLRYKLSKESAAKTASLLFQDNYSGRAEFGLTGDDDFHIKVSADGSTWREAIVIGRSTGIVSFPQGSSSDLELTVAELALGVADALNVAQFVGSSGNRIADSFDALTYVNTAGATNLNTGSAGLLKPTASVGADQLPTMTAATTSGVTISASTEPAGQEGWRAADKNNSSAWDTNTIAGPWWLKIDFGSAKTVASYTHRTRTADGTHAPSAWVLEGSNTGAFSGEQVTLDTRSGQSWTAGEVKTFTISSPGSYRYYRHYFTALVSGSDIIVAEITMLTASVTDNMTVTSTALTAASAPSRAKLVARVKEVDSITLNTDLIASVSRDNGSTWTAFTLTKRFTVSSISVYESDDLDISAQPSGTSMKWKLATANNKMIEINDVYLYWA